ncbi:conserved Plasmodium protein, unknown function [Plasmodium knowlesi strain H]|uniref:Uncharacterized protein n=3 Tax=Plasmodium knowlesi TaxID=5850 RepID=A0A5K1V5T0_PLAKH|nr:conserved Plasmodium protein, unknown function [Plasmodium knowlesi strain H]OTN68695.1 Uncharacterized protein PKNOH_S01022100 [Plasmodium knowlesi]CAA9986218.1 conserved Plasmodium protein, unknown function [Plasmodium knowlesi strain H]SBO25426.1 conserved Plasmodium protein, unknown function [Plasmodium knowlesi strain H]SBO27709.1 conserved Plasmodium protein, unknown function [Plasmodium knowlesi strain H]VVS75692.1 conserved Plasmodium protein, unknown function [Plasmodium knowlesi s|eukprot:XP_002257627.1 hypothetical protein, conserved in Plasmodium species [Plasmodium knowlesi strain H]
MNEESPQKKPLSIPGYHYDKKKNRYYLIDNELKKKLKEEEFDRQVNNAKRKNRQTNVEEKNLVIKEFHRIHGIKEMKKKKKHSNAHKPSVKHNDHQGHMSSDNNACTTFSKEKNLELINNELNSLKKCISKNQNIFNILKSIRNFHFRENSILSLPPIFINISSYQYIHVEDLCDLHSDNASPLCHPGGGSTTVRSVPHPNVQNGLDAVSIVHSISSLNNQIEDANSHSDENDRGDTDDEDGTRYVHGVNDPGTVPFPNPKRNDSMEHTITDIRFFNVYQKLIDENMIKGKTYLDISKNDPFYSYSNFRKQSTHINSPEEKTRSCDSRKKKNYSSKKIHQIKNENNMSPRCDGTGSGGLLIPKLFGRTHEKVNARSIQNFKSNIIINRYRANFYYFYQIPNRTYTNNRRRNSSGSPFRNVSSTFNASNSTNNNFNYSYSHVHRSRDEYDNINGTADIDHDVPNQPRSSTHNHALYNEIFEERSGRRTHENMPVNQLDVNTNETRILRTYKPAESFFHLFSNPLYEDFIFSTTKENNCSFSLGAIDIRNFIQKDNRSPLEDVIHENVYYNTDTKYFCTYSKENTELLCVSPQILSHFSIFNSEYIAYSSYPNMKDERSLLCMFNICSFFQRDPKIVTYSFASEINYFKLFPSVQQGCYAHDNGNTWDTASHTMNEGYEYHPDNKIDKIFICGSNPSFSFNAIKNDGVPYCIWDSKKLKVHDLLSMSGDLSCYVHNILSGNQHPFSNLIGIYGSLKKERSFHAKRVKEKRKGEMGNDADGQEKVNLSERKSPVDYHYEDDTQKKGGYNKRKHPSKGPNEENNDLHVSKHEMTKKRHDHFTDKAKHHLNNRSNKNNHGQYASAPHNSNEKMRNKHSSATPHNCYPSNAAKYNDNKKKGICCESVNKSNNNIFLCCNTEHIYLCDLRCNFLNTISKLKPNEGYVTKMYSLSNSFQYILSKTNNHIGLYDMRYTPCKHNETKSSLVTTYDRFIDNSNLRKHLNDFYVIDNEQFLVSLDTYTNSVHIYDIMNTKNRIINLDGNSDYSIYSNIHAYNNLSRIPYIYSSHKYDDAYYHYYKKKNSETKATEIKHMNHFSPIKTYPQKDLFIGLNVQSILPLFYVKQKYTKHNFISINEGGFICTINV